MDNKIFNNYMSPELINILENKYDITLINLEMINIFSLGMILIQLILLL